MKTLCFVVFFASSLLAQLPEAPQPVVDRNFWLVTSANGIATLGDIITTSKLVGHTASCPYEVWSDSLYGRQPNTARTSLVMGGLYAASVFSSYELKKHHAKLWKVPLWIAPQAYLAGGHAVGTIHNLQTCH